MYANVSMRASNAPVTTAKKVTCSVVRRQKRKKKKNEKCAQSNITSNSLNNKGETDSQWEEGKGKRNTDALTR